jgi:hypothetical protein
MSEYDDVCNDIAGQVASEFEAIISKQAKIIQRMAEWISKQDIDEDICKKVDGCKCTIHCKDNCNSCELHCTDCIIEYFWEGLSR